MRVCLFVEDAASDADDFSDVAVLAVIDEFSDVDDCFDADMCSGADVYSDDDAPSGLAFACVDCVIAVPFALPDLSGTSVLCAALVISVMIVCCAPQITAQ